MTPAPDASVARRCWRLLRLAQHLLLGAAATLLVVPALPARSRRRLRQMWSRRLLRVLDIRVVFDGAAPPPHGLIVANHVSWVDVFAINALAPAAFVAKAEVRGWPLIGWLATRHETLFLRRGSGGDARRIEQAIAVAIAAGARVAVFPEGTTTDGSRLLPFHAALLQAAVGAGHPVVPLALRYEDRRGVPSAAAAYTGETTLWQSMRSIVGTSGLTLRLVSAAPLATAGADRKTIARHAHAVIADALFSADASALRQAA